MNWKRWKIGAIVAIVLSFFCALSGLAAGMHWQAFLAVFGTALVTHFGSFIKDHPIDQIQFDTDRFEKKDVSAKDANQTKTE